MKYTFFIIFVQFKSQGTYMHGYNEDLFDTGKKVSHLYFFTFLNLSMCQTTCFSGGQSYNLIKIVIMWTTVVRSDKLRPSRLVHDFESTESLFSIKFIWNNWYGQIGKKAHDDIMAWHHFPYYCPLWGESPIHQWIPLTNSWTVNPDPPYRQMKKIVAQVYFCVSYSM